MIFVMLFSTKNGRRRRPIFFWENRIFLVEKIAAEGGQKFFGKILIKTRGVGGWVEQNLINSY